MRYKTTVTVACLLIGTLTVRGQSYSGYSQSSTPNFQVGTTDAAGRIVVSADWNTSSTAQPDFFQGETGTSYNLTFGPDANLYNCGLVNGSAFDNFVDSPPASLPFVINDASTGQATGSIPYNASAATIRSAIQSGLTTNWSNATITQNGNTYQVTNGVPGAKPLLSVSINSTVVQGFVAETRAGTASQPEVQTVTVQSTHYLFTIDGTAALPSLVTNNGTLNVLPPAPSNQTTSEIAFMQNATFINNGILGNFDCAVSSDSTAPWVLMHMGPNGHFVNNGVVSCCQGPYCGQTIFSASVENSGVIRTKWGASMEGAGVMNNYSTGALIQESPDSYGIQLYGGFNLTTQKATASNWGYIAAWTQGVYLAQPYSQFDDYGGPLEPGQMIYSPEYTPVDPNHNDFQVDLAYGGSIGAAYDSSGPGVNDTNSGGLGAATVSESAVYGNTLSVNLHNRVDTVRSSADGATPVGTLVNFMPIMYGDIAGVNLNNSNIVTLYFDDLTSDQITTINSAITAGTRLFDSSSTRNTVTATFTIGGLQYATQNIGQVVLAANKNPNIPVPTTTSIGVYAGSLSNPQFYAASSLQNPTTITLTGAGTPLKTGNLNIEAGWSLRLGKLTKQPNPVANGSAGPWVGTNDYTASLANCTGIEIDNGEATATGYSIDGVVQGTQAHALPGNLVVDNYSTPLVLPPLIGSGNFIQEGASTTTINTDRFKGTLYIPHGTLKMAQATSMSQVQKVCMQSSDVTRFPSTLDVSLAAAATPFTGSSFSSGIVLPTLLGTLPVGCFNVNDIHVIYPPVINLGSNNLVIGNGTGQSSSLFQGQIQGAGGLEVAPGTTLTLGGTIASGNTYSGSTYVDAGASLLFSTFPLNTTGQPLRMCGSGSLFNFGTIQTTSGNPQVGINSSSTITPQNAAGAGANRVIYVNGNYTQGTGGNLVLKLNSSLLASGGTPAAPGIASDYLKVSGTLTLGTDAYLTLNDVHPTALTQPATIVIAQAGSGTLGGANLFTSGTTGSPLYEGTIFPLGINSAVIHYGTQPNYPGAITLTVFPTGFDSWTSADIGAVGFAGGASYLNGAYTVTGSGADIWNAADAFQFVQQPLVGDGAIIARVTSVQNTSGWAKAGVMIRDSLAPGAPYFAAFMTPVSGLALQWRTANGGTSLNYVVSSATTPNWVKVARIGNAFSAYQSQDGVNWTLVRSAVTVAGVGNVAQAGLAVTSHNNAALCTAAFDSVNILPGAAWSAGDIGAPDLAGFTSYSDGLLSVEAGGTNLWGTSDQFRFVYQPVSGDCDIAARIAEVSDTNPKAKAGLMIRETLASDSPHYFLCATPEDGVFLQNRPDPAGSGSTYLKQTPTLGAPIWLRLKRSGSTLTTYTSADGVNWTVYTTVTNLSLSTNVYIGLALTGSDATTLGAAGFDSISVTASPAAPSNVSVTPLSDTQLGLNWSESSSGVTSYQIQISSDGTNWTNLSSLPAASPPTVINSNAYPFIASALGPNSTYFFQVSCTGTGGASAYSPSASGATGASIGDGIPGWWRLQYFGNGLRVIPGVSGSLDEPGSNGVPNLLAYATGLSPLAAGGSRVAALDGSGSRLKLTFNRLEPATLTYQVQASADLAAWTQIASLAPGAETWSGPATEIPVVETGAGSTRTVTVTDSQLEAASPRRLLRLAVVKQ